MDSVYKYVERESPLPSYYIDGKRSRFMFVETEETVTKRQEREAKAKKIRKERAEWAKARLRCKEKEEKALQKKRDGDQRVTQIRGRVDTLRKELANNVDDNKLKAELAYARTQLFWESNPF